jgi:Flp pilus assembly protein TadD
MTLRNDQANLLRQGLAFCQQGRFADAEACFRRVLALDPRHIDANTNVAGLAQRYLV